MKNITLKDIIIILLVLFMLWFVQCGNNKEPQVIKIEVPERVIKIDKADSIVYIPSKPQIIKIDGKEIQTENPVNLEMLKELIEAQRRGDSVEVLKKYIAAIGEKEQIRTFKQDGVKVDVTSKTRGDLLSQSVEVLIEKHNILVPIKEDKFGFLASGAYKQNLDSKESNFEVGAGVRIKKISVLGNINTNKEVGVTLIKEF